MKTSGASFTQLFDQLSSKATGCFRHHHGMHGDQGRESNDSSHNNYNQSNGLIDLCFMSLSTIFSHIMVTAHIIDGFPIRSTSTRLGL